MEALVASLPTVDVNTNIWGNGDFYVIDLDSGTEQNVITTTQVTTARGKNWTVYGRTAEGWKDYAGSTDVSTEIAYTFNSSGWGTFSAATSMIIPEGVKAYAVTSFDAALNTVAVEEIEDAIKDHTGVLLQGTPDAEVTFIATDEEADAPATNLMVAHIYEGNIAIAADDHFYGLYNDSGTAEFRRLTGDGVAPANRAYLNLNGLVGSEAPARLRLAVGNVVTGVEDINAAQPKSGQRYNLMGQPVGKDYKGVVFEDGKKIVVR